MDERRRERIEVEDAALQRGEQIGEPRPLIGPEQGRYGDAISSRDLRRLRGLVEGYELLFVDEAQRISEIGVNLKLLIDLLPHLRIVVTGSSSLDLASKVQEPLTGRAWVHRL